MTLYRLTVLVFIYCVLALAGLLGLWLVNIGGPGVSLYDLGSPQLRAHT